MGRAMRVSGRNGLRRLRSPARLRHAWILSAAEAREIRMPVVTCPKCECRYNPGMDEELKGIDPRQMSFKVVCPACGQWLRLPENEPVDSPAVPPHILKAMMSQSRLVERGPGSGMAGVAKKPWWHFWG